MPSNPPSRRHDLDALRVFACYLLLLFQVGMVFNPAPFFHIRNDASSFVFLILCGFIGLWHMPLLFLLAGWSAAASLRSRGAGAFLRERGRKLALPLLAGCVLLAPGIKYLELRSGQDLNHRGLFVTPEVQEQIRTVLPVELPAAEPFDESFLAFLPTFFTDLDRFTWSHLWFLAYLLVMSVVLLPVLAPLARRAPAGAGAPARVHGRGWVYAPILPLVLIQLTLRERFPGPYNLYSDWANLAFFATFLGAGCALAVVPGLEARLREEWRRALALGAAATGVLLAAVLGAFESKHVVLAGSAVAGWCFVVALLGLARERVTRSGPRLRYLAESAFPIYVLHQPVVVVLAAGVVALPLGIAAKFALLLAASTAGTVALYHFGVRPFGPPRFLLAMKPRSASAAGPAPGAALATARRLGRGTALALLAAPLLPAAAEAADPTGLWWAERGSAQVEIARCGDALCGRVAWLRHPFDEHGCPLRDAENPDPALRARPVVGLEILRNLQPAPGAAPEWNGGEIYDPTRGRTYDAVVHLDGPDRLRVRGFLGLRVLGRSTTWLRVGAEGECREGEGS